MSKNSLKSFYLCFVAPGHNMGMAGLRCWGPKLNRAICGWSQAAKQLVVHKKIVSVGRNLF